jgi:peptidoglycan/LPS O-acetylase OafA/YrhL
MWNDPPPAMTTTPTAPSDAPALDVSLLDREMARASAPPPHVTDAPDGARVVLRGRAPIPALTGVRVVLAAWIVCHHLLRWIAEGNPIVASDFGVLRQGQAATSGFFVLGGLGLYWAYGERLALQATLEDWGRYLRRRWAAVAPVGFIAAVLAIPFELKAGIMEGAELWGAFVANVLLVQAWLPMGGGDHGVSLRFNGPTWTLSMLLFWYALFPVIALLVHRHVHRRRGLVALGVLPWIAVVGMAWAFASEPLGVFFLHVHPFARGADILAGVAIGCWIVRYGRPSARAGWVLQPLAVAAVSISALAATWTNLDKAWYFGAWYIPCMALLAISLTARGGPLATLFAWKRLERPGRVAFPMLMLHVPFISLGWHYGLVRPDGLLVVAALLAACLILSWWVHLKVERPLVRRISGASSAPALAAPVRP